MKLVTYRYDGAVEVGAIAADGKTVERLLDPGTGAPASDLAALVAAHVAGGQRPLETDPDQRRSLDEVELLAPLTTSGRNVMCVGKNYREHSAEFARSGYDASSSAELPPHPIVFTKPFTSIVGPGAEVHAHAGVTSALDYEAEVAVVIGRGGKQIAREDAWDHVWGYALLNDVTARDLQQRHTQWFIGKSLDTFCPLGPWLVTADEVDGTAIELECHVNGELRQKATTADLIFDIPELVSVLSQGMRLRPGDIIATGTPAGVGLGFDPPRFLQPGDTVTVSSPQLGSLENVVTEGAS